MTQEIQEVEIDERAGLGSASGYERDIRCPGNRNMQNRAPKDKGTQVADQGTKIHEALDTGDLSELEEDEEEIARRLHTLEEEEIKKWKAHLKMHMADEERLREERFFIRDDNLAPIYSAKPDLVVVCGNHAIVMDDKTGFLEVPEASINSQLRCQAVSVHHEMPKLQSIRVVLLEKRFKERVSTCDYDLDSLSHANNEIATSIWRTSQADAHRSPGSWCMYCRAKSICPEAGAYAIVTSVHPRIPSKEPAGLVEALTNEQCVEILRKKSVVEKIFDEIKDRLKKMSPEALEAIGVKLQQGNEKTIITSNEEARSLLLGFFAEDDVDAISKVSLSDATNLYKANTNCTDKEARAGVESLLKTVITKTRNAPSLKIKK